jgi:hypothetical protein
MDMKEAVSSAKAYVREAFSDDRIINLGLEEVEYDPTDREWLVTIGFSRPWDRPKRSAVSSAFFPVESDAPPEPLNREYRIVRIRDNGEVLSVRLRDVAA